MAFDPQAHLIQLPKRVKDKATGQWTTVYQDYLEVKFRVLMFQERYPHGSIVAEEVCIDLDRGYARYKATVADGEGGLSTAHGTETQEDFGDYAERAETRAVGRALALLGFGTAYVCADLTEGEHLADAPVTSPTAEKQRPHGEAVVSEPSSNGHTLLPTNIPEGHKLPCGGALIEDLTPPQLVMLIGKVGLRLLAEPSYTPLQAALQAERNRRLEAGKRPQVTES